MKIAILSSGFLPIIDGVTVSLLHRLRYLSSQNHQVLLFCPSYEELSEEYPNWEEYTGDILPGIEVINLPSQFLAGLEFERNITPESYQMVLEKLQQFQPDLIHVDEPERLWLGFLKRPGLDFAHQHQIPCVSFFHTNFIEYLEDFFPLPSLVHQAIRYGLKFHRSWIYNGYDATLVSSKVTQEKIIKSGIKNTIYADLLGIDLEAYNINLRQPDFFQTAYNLPDLEGKIKLVFLGRLTPDKGWKFTLLALEKLFQEIAAESVALMIVGEGSLRQELEEELSQITPNAYFFGCVAPDKVPAILINSDIHITTSEKETKGLTILEAGAAKIPVLAPSAGGIIDSIEDSKNGFLYPPGNLEDFVTKLRYLIENPDLRHQMGENGRIMAAAYNWENSIKNLVEIWNQQIDNYLFPSPF